MRWMSKHMLPLFSLSSLRWNSSARGQQPVSLRAEPGAWRCSSLDRSRMACDQRDCDEPSPPDWICSKKDAELIDLYRIGLTAILRQAIDMIIVPMTEGCQGYYADIIFKYNFLYNRTWIFRENKLAVWCDGDYRFSCGRQAISWPIIHCAIDWDFIIGTWWRHEIETLSELLVFLGESTGHWWFPSQRPVMRSFTVFIDVSLRKLLNKQSGGR